MDRSSMDTLVTVAGNRCGHAWHRMVLHLREVNSADAIADRLHTAQPIAGIEIAAASFAAGIHGAYVHGGQATARWLHGQVVRKKLLTFDAASPTATSWAQRNRYDKIREVTDDQRKMVQAAIIGGATTGVGPRVVAQEIYDSIGLTAYQLQIVANLRRQLKAGGSDLVTALERQLINGTDTRTLLAAIRNGKPIPPDRIDAMVEAYRKAYQRYRAETIARTEGLRVAHQASDEAMGQAVTNGDIAAAQIERKWVHRRRVGERKEHAAMAGQLRGFGETFTSGSGAELAFPCDPQAPIEETANCTCVVTTRIRRAA